MSMIVGFLVCDATSGAILRLGTWDDEDLASMAGEGEVVVQVDAAVPVDPVSQVYDFETEALVDVIPSAPPDDEWATWSWDAVLGRYVATPTLAALKRDAILPVQRQIETVERAQVRPTSAIVLALLASETPDAGDVTQLTTLETDKTGLRDFRTEIEAAATVEALNALLDP
nr:hypothetical protein [uncultured Roseateles sp.]